SASMWISAASILSMLLRKLASCGSCAGSVVISGADRGCVAVGLLAMCALLAAIRRLPSRLSASIGTFHERRGSTASQIGTEQAAFAGTDPFADRDCDEFRQCGDSGTDAERDSANSGTCRPSDLRWRQAHATHADARRGGAR